MTNKLKVLDLFSGIGMFSYGLEKTGLYETVAFCEWDEGCREVLKKHWPETYCYKDIKQLEWHDGYLYSEDCGVASFTDVDMICGGFPCQDISQANQRAEGISGERSGHWKHYWRLINEIKPKVAIIENVSALLRRGIDVVLHDLHEIGYDAEWHCIPASALGACHQRDRVWILAYRRFKGRPRLEPMECIGTSGQGRWGGKEDLQQIYDDPYGRSHKWPEPLLRRVDVRYPRRVDRLKQVGNTVYWPIVEQIGYHVHRYLNETTIG